MENGDTLTGKIPPIPPKKRNSLEKMNPIELLELKKRIESQLTKIRDSLPASSVNLEDQNEEVDFSEEIEMLKDKQLSKCTKSPISKSGHFTGFQPEHQLRETYNKQMFDNKSTRNITEATPIVNNHVKAQENPFNKSSSLNQTPSLDHDESTLNLNGNVINDSRLVYRPKHCIIEDFDTVKKNTSSSNNIESTSEK